jgi:hypothetical protein
MTETVFSNAFHVTRIHNQTAISRRQVNRGAPGNKEENVFRASSSKVNVAPIDKQLGLEQNLALINYFNALFGSPHYV